MQRPPHHLFIVGSQRSGTTLLGQLLGAHPASILLDEHDGLHRLVERPAARTTALHAVTTRWSWFKSYRAARSKYRQPGTRFNIVGWKSRQIEHLIWKMPNAVFHVEEIVASFDSPKFVVLQRDIRAVVASMLALQRVDILGNQVRRIERAPLFRKWFPTECRRVLDPTEPVEVRLALIAKTKMAVAPRLRALGMHVTEVAYERLVAEPGRVLEELQRFCELEPLPLHEAHYRTQLVGTGPGDTERGRPVVASSVERWRQELDADQLRNLEAALDSDLESKLEPHLEEVTHAPAGSGDVPR